MKDRILSLTDSDVALQPFLAAARESSSSNISTLRALISKVLSNAGIFAGYDELKAIVAEALQQAGPEGTKLANTLDLFSYGTFKDYTSNPDNFISLTDAQTHKIRQLTVLTLAQTHTDRLFYTTVQDALGIKEPRAVEQILISCLYSGVINGRLCQKTKSLRLMAPIRSRDVPLSSLDSLLQSVRTLQSRVSQARTDLSHSASDVQQNLQHDNHYWKHVDSKILPAASDKNTWPGDNPVSIVEGFLTTAAAEVTSAAAAMDVTGRRQKRSRGGVVAGMASAFQV